MSIDTDTLILIQRVFNGLWQVSFFILDAVNRQWVSYTQQSNILTSTYLLHTAFNKHKKALINEGCSGML